MIRLGDEVRDAVKGFKGAVVYVDKQQVGIQRTCASDGGPADLDWIHWINVEHVVLTKKKPPENTGSAEAERAHMGAGPPGGGGTRAAGGT